MLIGDWILKLDSGELLNVHDQNRKKNLTSKLLLFVNTLVEGNGQIVAKSQIIDQVWGGHTSPENITQVINKLRVIFEDVDKNLFVNHPSVGYSLKFSSYSNLVVLGAIENKSLCDNRSDIESSAPVQNGQMSKNSKYSPLIRCSWVVALVLIVFLVVKEEYKDLKVDEFKLNLKENSRLKICEYECHIREDNEKLHCE
ncbi:winged helix-turn-helix domain-containing protein [Vibrio jasicida]|uniref:winged helix-turn-helix domain-containing protein n=1 Tax=Vibrio jasicida TaxID=766224 RepID=UPI00390B4BF6